MQRRHRVVLLLLPVVCLCGALLFQRMGAGAATPATHNAPQSAVLESYGTLFPEVEAADITAVSIKTPQASFDLLRGDDRSVSINGQRWDGDVFVTLLEHITDMEFIPTTPFDAQDAPLLSLVIRHRGVEHTASFYPGDAAGANARIIVGPKSDPRYGLTDGWRIGTLLLACEGTRIQDESGRETPAQ